MAENNEKNENSSEICENSANNDTKKVKKATITSLIAQIVACLWVAVWSAKKFIGGDCNVDDIIYSGFAIAGCFSPIYLNMILDKIKNIKQANNE